MSSNKRFIIESNGVKSWLYHEGRCVFEGPVEFARKLHRAAPVPDGETELRVVLRRKHAKHPKALRAGMPLYQIGPDDELDRQPPYRVWSWGEVHVLDGGKLRHKVRLPKRFANQFYVRLRGIGLTERILLVDGMVSV